VVVSFGPRDDCRLGGARRVPNGGVGIERYERSGPAATRIYTFPGGCVTYELNFNQDGSPELIFDVEEALGFVPRTQLVEHVRNLNGLALCGAGAECVG